MRHRNGIKPQGFSEDAVRFLNDSSMALAIDGDRDTFVRRGPLKYEEEDVGQDKVLRHPVPIHERTEEAWPLAAIVFAVVNAHGPCPLRRPIDDALHLLCFTIPARK